MNIARTAAIGFAFATAFIASASAAVIQTGSGSGQYDSYEAWGLYDVSTVSLAKGTNQVSALQSSAIAYDQGWGGEWTGGNQVILALYNGGTQLWSEHVAGAGHYTYGLQSYSAGLDALASLNAALGKVAWNDTTALTMRMQANPVGWGGWELHVRNAQFSMSSDVPEPASLALLGMGLAGLAAGRRRKAKQA